MTYHSVSYPYRIIHSWLKDKFFFTFPIIFILRSIISPSKNLPSKDSIQFGYTNVSEWLSAPTFQLQHNVYNRISLLLKRSYGFHIYEKQVYAIKSHASNVLACIPLLRCRCHPLVHQKIQVKKTGLLFISGLRYNTNDCLK